METGICYTEPSFESRAVEVYICISDVAERKKNLHIKCIKQRLNSLVIPSDSAMIWLGHAVGRLLLYISPVLSQLTLSRIGGTSRVTTT